MTPNHRLVLNFLGKEFEKLEKQSKVELQSTLFLFFWTLKNSKDELYLKNFNKFLKVFDAEDLYNEYYEIFLEDGGMNVQFPKLVKVAAWLTLVAHFAECHTRVEEEKMDKSSK